MYLHVRRKHAHMHKDSHRPGIVLFTRAKESAIVSINTSIKMIFFFSFLVYVFFLVFAVALAFLRKQNNASWNLIYSSPLISLPTLSGVEPRRTMLNKITLRVMYEGVCLCLSQVYAYTSVDRPNLALQI